MRFLVINGPNLNMLGVREPDIYGTTTYDQLCEIIAKAGTAAGVQIDCFQSNSEGELVTAIQKAYGVYDGIIINPAAYTHTSIAILDALKAVAIPAVEVHLSDPFMREEFRHRSYPGLACVKTFKGQGPQGYEAAILWLREYLGYLK